MAADVDHSSTSRLLLDWGQLLILLSFLLLSIICTFPAYAVNEASDVPAANSKSDSANLPVQNRILPTLPLPEPS